CPACRSKNDATPALCGCVPERYDVQAYRTSLSGIVSEDAAVLPAAAKQQSLVQEESNLARFLPEAVRDLADPQKDIPRIAKDEALTAQIEQTLPLIPTTHHLYLHDSRTIELPPESVHLVVTSPPYWTLKEYNRTEGQLGYVTD